MLSLSLLPGFRTLERRKGETAVLTDVSDVFNNGLKKHVFRIWLASLR